MDKAAKYVIGNHDFRNICKMDVANGVINFKRTVMDARVSSLNQNVEKSTGILNFFSCLIFIIDIYVQ